MAASILKVPAAIFYSEDKNSVALSPPSTARIREVVLLLSVPSALAATGFAASGADMDLRRSAAEQFQGDTE